MSNIILPRNFYERSTLIVAGELLGKVLKFSNFSGIITEVEAYIGMNDPACHAARGYTNRTSVMFGVPGFSYVYFIYGMYYCLNIVTEAEGFPAPLEPLEANLGGPGILCKRLNITKEHNKQDLTISHEFCVYESHLKPDYICTRRIGISKGQEKFWRFKIF
ncbi:DNA-3-methyladenine glycosylase [Wolbachia endosymbiont of Glossina morsitans morsitans]|uniref:DNA-3-methyladenine glycosylase n=1 Tax=Wolbachia endosymbiont of Glossina morsitans morsitans TaxID=1150948 RepID=UPI00045A1450|nr:DNA-3-methyladenine glycosylase [Wolbachia endosymbiont of Glossina morsitans morsitans]KDB19523.1 3-methyladenine DNA glycosylase [Wolbachia endosymbiont of Glossina morsitans morsitans]